MRWNRYAQMFLKAEIREDKKRREEAEVEQKRPGLTTQERANFRAVCLARTRRIAILDELITKLDT